MEWWWFGKRHYEDGEYELWGVDEDEYKEYARQKKLRDTF
jgi:hypothetical protein